MLLILRIKFILLPALFNITRLKSILTELIIIFNFT